MGSKNCWNKYAYDSSMNDFSGTATSASKGYGGIFRDAGPFADYNVIYIDKCVGDRNLGDTTVSDYLYRNESMLPTELPVDEYIGPVYFHGFRILKATLRGVASQSTDNPFGAIMFYAGSNGSNGLYMYLDRIADFVHTEISPSVQVRGVAASMVRSSIEVEATVGGSVAADYARVYDSIRSFGMLKRHITADAESPAEGMWFSPDVYREDGLEFMRARSWGSIDATPTIDQSCIQAHASDPEACLDHMHVLLNHISTPIFIVAQQLDSTIRTGSQHRFTSRFSIGADCNDGDACCHSENYLEGYDCTFWPDHPYFMANVATYSEPILQDRVLTTMRALWTGFADRSEMSPSCTGPTCDRSTMSTVKHGAFIDDIDSHGALSNDWKALSQINSRSLEDYLADWLVTGVDTFCVDTSQGYSKKGGTSAPWASCP